MLKAYRFVVALFVGSEVVASATTESALPRMAVYERFVAIDQACGWPLLVNLPDGEIGAFLWPVSNHGFSEGAVEFWSSRDGGRSWQRVGVPVPNQPTQNRMNHAGGVIDDGRLVALVSGWTGRAPATVGASTAELQAAAVPFDRSRTLAPVPAVSTDGGRSWRQFPAIAPAASADAQGEVPYGRMGQLGGGELGVFLYREGVHFYTSADDGETWQRRGQLAGDSTRNETAWVRLTNGELLAASRTDGSASVVAYRSRDDGHTWTEEQPLTLPGQHPADLLLLPNGQVLLSYGVRNQGHWAIHLRWGDAEGRRWSAPTVLVELEGATDQRFAAQPSRDGGYPSTVRLDDGTFVTAYYSRGMPSHNRYHVGVVRWKLDGE